MLSLLTCHWFLPLFDVSLMALLLLHVIHRYFQSTSFHWLLSSFYVQLIASLVLHVIHCYFHFTCHSFPPSLNTHWVLHFNFYFTCHWFLVSNNLSLIATFIYMSLIPLSSSCHLLLPSNIMSLIATVLLHAMDCNLLVICYWLLPSITCR